MGSVSPTEDPTLKLIHRVGAPIDVTPLKDDPALSAKHPDRTNDFQFAFPEDNKASKTGQTRCPFAAHVRKTNPRNDLGGQNQFNNHRILRRGIQFGPEVTDVERQGNKTLKERGLLFACFQSNLDNGFNFIQKSEYTQTSLLLPSPCDRLLTQRVDHRLG